jgi:hypothetical protein
MQSRSAHEGDSERVITAQRDTIAQQDETIRDLRARLDASEAERRRLSERLTGLLTDRQTGSVPAVPAKRVPLWRRWFR